MMNYLVEAVDLDAHLFRISLPLPARRSAPTVLKLPVWIAGSYLVREFSRHVVRIAAQAGDVQVKVEQTAKNAWAVAPGAAACTVRYEVYAYDLSVRTAWLDAERGFFNGTSLFMYTDASRSQPCRVEIVAPKDPRTRGWELASTLTRVGAARPRGFGVFSAADYDELIDKPVTMGRLQRAQFAAHGTPHEIVVTGAGEFDIARLAADVQKVCEAQIALFEPKAKRAPFERYCFMLHASGDGYGGLEHRDSTALICRRADLPLPLTPPQPSPASGEGVDASSRNVLAPPPFTGGGGEGVSAVMAQGRATPPQPSPASGEGVKLLKRASSKAQLTTPPQPSPASGEGAHRPLSPLSAEAENGVKKGMTDGYVTLLGLFSHEYFHAWNVKRIKPRAFEPYLLDRENPTRLLWLFEGFTAYYDDLMLLRAGLIDEARYFKLLARNIHAVHMTPGRRVESVADASFNAWLKYYRADENTPNSTVSYYLKGALVALALDLTLRQRTAHTLDDLMRQLWQRFVRGEPGLGEDELPAVIEQLCGLKLQGFFAQVVNGTADPELSALFEAQGLRLQAVADTQPFLGGTWEPRDDGLRVNHALSGGALQRAGLARGDLIVALNGEQLNRSRWDALKATLRPGVPVTLHYFRDGLLREARLTPQPPAIKEWTLARADSATAAKASVAARATARGASTQRAKAAVAAKPTEAAPPARQGKRSVPPMWPTA